MRSRLRRITTSFLVGGLAALLAGCTTTTTAPIRTALPGPTGSPTTAAVRTATADVLRTFRVVSVGRSPITAAGDGALYAAIAIGEDDADWRIDRLDPTTGTVTRRTLHLPQLARLAVGPDGLYVSTSMIDKYGMRPDTILRLDLATLQTRAERRLDDHAFWDGDVVLAASGSLLTEMDGGGTIRLLDPRSLATIRSVRVLSTSDQEGGDDIASPVFRDGRLWVLARHRILSYSLPGLRPESSAPQGLFDAIVDTSDGLTLVGEHMAELSGSGAIAPDATSPEADTADSAQAAIAVGALVAEQPDDLHPRIVLRQRDGSVASVLHLDAENGLLLAGADGILWAEGVGATGPAISAIRLQ